jgi:hypothetical protein
MEQPDDPATWFAKEKGVYYAVFWVPLGLFLVQMLEGLLELLNRTPENASIQTFLHYVPYVMLVLSFICAIWGAGLVVVGIRKRLPVLALVFATIGSSLPCLLLLGFLFRHLYLA